MGLFKSKEERRLERDIKIRQGIRRIEKAIEKTFDLTPAGIIKTLDLKKPIFQSTSNYGHFGRDGFTWEKTDRADKLKRDAARAGNGTKARAAARKSVKKTAKRKKAKA